MFGESEFSEYDRELEEIKRRKLLEYQRLLELERLRRAEEERRLFEARKEAYLRTILTPEARQRLNNLKLVRPELVEKLEIQLIQLAQSGQIKTPIDDETLKEILRNIDNQLRKEIKLRVLRTRW